MSDNITTISIKQDIITTEDGGIKLTLDPILDEKLGEDWNEKFKVVDLNFNMIDDKTDKVHYTVDLKEVNHSESN
jgi:hypothetical protein